MFLNTLSEENYGSFFKKENWGFFNRIRELGIFLFFPLLFSLDKLAQISYPFMCWMNWYIRQYLDNQGPALSWKHNSKWLPRAKNPQTSNWVMFTDCGWLRAGNGRGVVHLPKWAEHLGPAVWTGKDALRQAASMWGTMFISLRSLEPGHSNTLGCWRVGEGNSIVYFILLRSVFFLI